MNKERILEIIKSCGLVAVVRAKNSDEARRIAEACIAGGVAGIELTYTVPGVTEIIRALSQEYYDNDKFVIGAGTVLDPETARDAILAGAQYIVSPCLNLETVRLCNRYRVPVMPGAMTIREALDVMESGADIIKIFPGELFGPSIIKAIKGPLPNAQMMPTGGVNVTNAGDWIKAGAVAVGAGSSLTGGAASGDYQSITELAKQFIEAIQKAREKGES